MGVVRADLENQPIPVAESVRRWQQCPLARLMPFCHANPEPLSLLFAIEISHHAN
jgi:hypothetical protein